MGRQWWWGCLPLLAAGLLLPLEARADGINMGFVVVAGTVVLVPLMLFEILVESAVLGPGLRVPWRQTWSVLLAANLLSLAAGLPVKLFNTWMYAECLPRQMAPHFRLYPWAVALGTAGYFVVTLLVEYPVVARWCRRLELPVRRRRVALAVLGANVATYAILAPLHYYATRPRHDVKEFTDDTRWAAQPPSAVLYISPANQLCAVNSDGTNRRIVIPFEVVDYQYQADSGRFLYWDRQGDCYLFHEGEVQPRRCLQGMRRCMAQVACSPDGKSLAYLAESARGHYQLHLLDTTSGDSRMLAVVGGSYGAWPEVAWSDQPATFLLKEAGRVDLIQMDTGGGISRRPAGPDEVRLARVYGHFRGYRWDGVGPRYEEEHTDKHGTTEVWAVRGLGSRVLVTTPAGHFAVADNPGLLRLGDRFFNAATILDNGNEVIFGDFTDVYLLDVNHRRVGWLAQGGHFILLGRVFERRL